MIKQGLRGTNLLLVLLLSLHVYPYAGIAELSPHSGMMPTSQNQTTTTWEGTLNSLSETGSPGAISFEVQEDAAGTPTAVAYSITINHLVMTDDGPSCATGAEATYTGDANTILPWAGGEAGYTWTANRDFSGTDPRAYSISGLLGRTLAGDYVGPETSEGAITFFYEFDIGNGDTFTIRCFWNWSIGPDGGGTLEFASASYEVRESAGQATITVVRTGSTDGAVTVDYTVDSDTAQVGLDFTATMGTLTFGPGETQKDFIVPILPDNISEGVETATPQLSNPSEGAELGAQSAATLEIDDRLDLIMRPFDLNQSPLVQQGANTILQNITIEVENSSHPADPPANNIVVEVKHGNNIVHAPAPFALAPNTVQTIRFDWDVTALFANASSAPTLTLEAVVDPGNAYIEVLETNNSYISSRATIVPTEVPTPTEFVYLPVVRKMGL
ncbi:MAG: Calx-beta domain-containing protein [Chloroflexota bacterium]